MNYTVYMHTTPSGKRYVGITKQRPERRWKNGTGYATHRYFYNAIKKHGWENIEHKIMSNWHTKEEAEELEKYLIKRFKTNFRKYGYNLTSGGETGYEVTDEVRKKMSKSAKGRVLSKEQRENLSKANKGRTHSKEARNKMSKAKKGKHISTETKEKIGKPVNMLSEKMVVIKRFTTITSALQELGKPITCGNISSCCKGKIKTAYGYKWEYAEKEKTNEI